MTAVALVLALIAIALALLALLALCAVVSATARGATEPPEWAKRLSRNGPDGSGGAE